MSVSEFCLPSLLSLPSTHMFVTLGICPWGLCLGWGICFLPSWGFSAGFSPSFISQRVHNHLCLLCLTLSRSLWRRENRAHGQPEPWSLQCCETGLWVTPATHVHLLWCQIKVSLCSPGCARFWASGWKSTVAAATELMFGVVLMRSPLVCKTSNGDPWHSPLTPVPG